MKEEIVVSVYCLTYNHEKYIRDALNGFISQITDFKYEVIIHDDASTDNTANIIKEYAKKYPDIIKPILQKENQYSKGIPILKQHILPKISGKYIAICEGDDFWTDKNKLQTQVDFLDKNPEYVACVHNTTRWNLKSNKKSLVNPNSFDYDASLSDVIQGGGCVYQTSSLMYQTVCALKRYSDSVSEYFYVPGIGDYPLAIFLALEGKIRFLSKNMSTYRVFTEGSWTSRHQNADAYIIQTQNVISMLNSVNEYTKHKHKKLINDVINKHLYNMHLFTWNVSALKSDMFKVQWKDTSLIRKGKYWMKNKHPRLFSLITKII